MSRFASVGFLALVLAGGPGAAAQDRDGTTARDEPVTAQRQTIRGMVAEVIIVGETMIDEETHRAAIAPMSYLTVLGSPSPGDAPAAAPACESAGWHRANVYRLAITPQTRVYEAGAGRGAASGPNDAAHRERSPSTFEGLELGDRVEVELIKQDTPERTARDSRHGRDRTFRGTAVSITILPEVPSDDNS